MPKAMCDYFQYLFKSVLAITVPSYSPQKPNLTKFTQGYMKKNAFVPIY